MLDGFCSGIYELLNGTFVGFNDFFYTGLEPNSAQIQSVVDLLPNNYFFRPLVAVDNSIYRARDQNNGTILITAREADISMQIWKTAENYELLSAVVNRVDLTTTLSYWD